MYLNENIINWSLTHFSGIDIKEVFIVQENNSSTTLQMLLLNSSFSSIQYIFYLSLLMDVHVEKHISIIWSDRKIK